LVGQAAHTAREKLKGTFILLRIAEAEGIKVGREELMGRIATLAHRYGMGFDKMVKELEARNAMDQIQEEIITSKVLDFLVQNAVVAELPAETQGAPATETTEAIGTSASEVQS
jgi:trigger factor